MDEKDLSKSNTHCSATPMITETPAINPSKENTNEAKDENLHPHESNNIEQECNKLDTSDKILKEIKEVKEEPRKKLKAKKKKSSEKSTRKHRGSFKVLKKLEAKRKKLYAKLETLKKKKEKYIKKKVDTELKEEYEKKFTEAFIKRYRSENATSMENINEDNKEGADGVIERADDVMNSVEANTEPKEQLVENSAQDTLISSS